MRLRHWSDRFIYMYANWFTFVFNHAIKQTGEVLEDVWDTMWQILLGKMFTVAPESDIMRTRKIGLIVWDSCAPVVRVFLRFYHFQQ